MSFPGEIHEQVWRVLVDFIQVEAAMTCLGTLLAPTNIIKM